MEKFTGWAETRNNESWLGYFENNRLKYCINNENNVEEWISEELDYTFNPNIDYKATDKEVEFALIQEAQKRGFKEGVVVNPPNESWARNIKTHLLTDHDKVFWYTANKELLCCGVQIFYNGKWAEIVPEKKKSIKISEMPGSRERPDHYKEGIDTFDRMEANMDLKEKLAAVRCNIDKYTWRKKNQDRADFTKIIAYANWAITQIDKDESEA
jgi:hypothetical protein